MPSDVVRTFSSAGLTVDVVKDAVTRIAVKMDACAGELNALDGALGDGDLGVTMVRGMHAVVTDLDACPADVGGALAKCAQAFTKTSGSTLGTLVATGLLAAAKATKGQTSVAWRDVSALVAGALAAMASRGKAQLGDKTVLDALEAVRVATEGRDDPAAMLAASLSEVRRTLDRLRAEPARQGRARIFAEKTIGRDDPGMIAILRVLEGLASRA